MGIPKKYDLTGKRFDKLLVIKYDHSDKRGRYWLCKCDCGNMTIKNAWKLKNNVSHSCGCDDGSYERGESQK